MLLFSIPVLGLAVLSSLILYRLVIYPVFISPLSKIPNAHWTSPISPLWILWTRYRCRENRTVHAAHLKYGSVIRLGPNELSVNDVGALRTVYAGGFEKGQWYSLFDNYGYVHWLLYTSRCQFEFGLINTQWQRPMYVLRLAFSATFCSKTDDLEYIFQVKHS